MTVFIRAMALALLCAVLLALAACSGPSTDFIAVNDVAGASDSKDTSKACKPAPKCKPAKKPKQCKPHKHKAGCKCKCQAKCYCKKKCQCPPPAPTNEAPVAVITAATVDGRHVQFSGADSTDADGTIVWYEWDFDNDGDFELGSNSPNGASTFGLGHHVVTLRVTDDEDATDTAKFEFDVQNQLPEAVINLATASGTTYQLSGEESRDWDGTIVQYEWDFDGDGNFDALSPEPTISHSFPGGDWNVTLRVTDNDGGSGTASTIVHGNIKPEAKISVEFEEIIPSVLVRYTLRFDESSDAEGPLDSGFYTINGGTPIDISDWSAPVVIDVNEFDEKTVVLSVRDGLWMTDTQLVALTVTGPVFADD
jgi:hypothetical protein